MTTIRIDTGTGTHVEVDAYEYLVHLELCEGDDSISLSLDPAEARAVAAMLVHQATEVTE